MYNIDLELEKIKQDYNLVGFKQQDGYIFYGDLNLNHKYNNIVLQGSLYISLFVPFTYPQKLPIVKDITKKIDRDFHKNENDILCVACDAEIYLELNKKNPATISDYIEMFLLPYLYSYIYYKKYNHVPFGEREHGVLGIIGFYEDYFKLSNKENAIKFLKYLAIERYRGHIPCICNSGKRLRKCHGADIISLVEIVGKENLINDYNKYLESLEWINKERRRKKRIEYKKMQQRKKLNYYLFPPKNPFEVYIPKFYEKYYRR